MGKFIYFPKVENKEQKFMTRLRRNIPLLNDYELCSLCVLVMQGQVDTADEILEKIVKSRVN